MGLDISSKSGLSFYIGYGGYFFMRCKVLDAIQPGLGLMYDWSTSSDGGMPLHGIEEKYDDKDVPRLAYGTSRSEFAKTCGDLLWCWLNNAGYKALARHFIYHSDCDGKLTATQCKRLVKDFDKIVNPPKGYEDKFAEFRKLVKTAADRNETLFFG